jgi:hypothetical protein
MSVYNSLHINYQSLKVAQEVYQWDVSRHNDNRRRKSRFFPSSS